MRFELRKLTKTEYKFMKKSFLSILAISALMVSCGGNNTENKSEAQPAETTNV